MKLHLPKGLRSALLACFAAFAGIGTTITSATITGGVFAVAIGSQTMAAITVSAANDTTTVSMADGTATVTADGTVNISADSGGSVTIAADGGGTVNVGALSLSALKSAGNDITIEATEGTTVVTGALYNMDGDGSWSSADDSMLSDLTLTGDVTVKIVDGGFSVKSADITINAGATLYTGALMSWQGGEGSNYTNVNVNGGTLSLDNPDDNAGRYGLFSYGTADAGGLNVNVINGGKLLATNNVGAGNDIGVGSGHSNGFAKDGDATLHLAIGNDTSAGLVAARSIRFSNSTTSTVVMNHADSLLILRDGFKQNESGDSQVYLNAGTLAGYVGSDGVSDRWSSAADMTVGNVVIHTSVFTDSTGEWKAGTDGLTMTLKADVTGIAGTQLTVDGTGTLAIAGKLTLTDAIKMGANASLTLLEGAKIDVANLATDGNSWTLLTADDPTQANLNISALAGVEILNSGVVAEDGKLLVWSVEDGKLVWSTAGVLSYAGGTMDWGVGSAFTGGAFTQGSQVIFNGTEESRLTLTEDISSDKVTVEAGATVSLLKAEDAAYKLDVLDALVNNGTLKSDVTISAHGATNSGTFEANGGLAVTGDVANTGTLVLGAGSSVSGTLTNSGTVTAAGNTTIGTLDATNGAGTVSAANGATLTISNINYGTNDADKHKWWSVLSSWDAQAGDTGLVVIENVPGMDGGFAFENNTNNITGRYHLKNQENLTLGNYYNGFNATTTHIHENAYLKLDQSVNLSSYETFKVDGTLVIDGNVDLGHTSGGNYYGRMEVGSTGVVAINKLHFYGAGDADNRFYLKLDGGTLVLGGDSQYQGITVAGDAAPDVNLNSGTVTLRGSWFAAPAMTVGDVTFDTTMRVEDAATGAWVADTSVTQGEIELRGVVTVNGTMTVTGAGTLCAHNVVNNGIINVDGTLQLVNAITMGADAEFNILGGKIDLSQLTAVGGVYTLLTATDTSQANLDLSGKLTTDDLTGFAGNMADYEWSFNTDGTISYSSTNILKYAGGSLAWSDAATGFEGGKAFSQGAPVTFQGDTTATLAENIESDELKVESNVTLTLVDADVEGTPAGNTLKANTVENEGTIDSNVAFTATTLLNKGSFVANAALSAGSLTNDGTLEVNADSTVTTYDAASIGTYMVATDKTLTVGSAEVEVSSQAFTSLLSAGRADDTHAGKTTLLGKQSVAEWGLTYMKDLSGTLDISAAYDVTSLGKLMLQTAAESTMTTTLNKGGMLEASQLILTSGQTFIVKDGAVLKTNGSTTESLFVQGGANLTLEGGSIIAQTLRESNDAKGGTFSMTGGSLTLVDSLHRTDGSFSLLGGSLKTADDDGWSMNGEVTLGAVTIDAANTAAITANGPVIFAGTVDNDSSLVIGAAGTTPVLSVAEGGLSKLTFEEESTGRTSGNGFAMGTYWLVDGRDATSSSLTLNKADDATDVRVTVGDDSYQVTATGGSLSFSAEALGGDYYINENSETYGGANATIPTAGLEDIILRDATLVMGADWDASANNAIRVAGQSTISLEGGVTLKGHDALIADQCTLTLEGSGTYVLRSVDDIPLLTSLKDSTAWTGTLDLYCDDHGGACNMTGAGVTVAGQDLNVLGNANSTVVVRGTTGYFAAGDVNTNVEFGTTGADVPALTISGTTGDYGLNITGKISGEGSVVIADDNTGKVSLGLGDTSGWTGSITANATTTSEVTFNVVDNQVINTVVNGNADVTYLSTSGGRFTLTTDSNHTGKTTINGIGVDLGATVTSIGSEVVLNHADLTVQGNQLAADVIFAGGGEEVRLRDGASISSLTIASQAGGTLYVSEGASSITGDLTVAADATYNHLALSSKLTVGGEVSGLTSLYINDAKADQLVADTFTLGATQSLAVEVVGGNLSASEVGIYTLVSAETLTGVLEDQLSLLVSGSADTVTDNGDGSFTVGQILYTLGIVDNSIVLTGAFQGIPWNDSDGDSWSKDATNGFSVVPAANSMVSFEGSDTVTIDGSKGTIEVAAVRVDTAQAPGYTFTGSSAETDRLQIESLVVAQGDLALDKVGVDAGVLVVGQSSGVAAGLEVREGSAVTAADMTVHAGSGKGLVINAGGTVDVMGALKTDAGVTITNQGALSMGMGSSVAAIAGVDGKTGTITAATGTVNIGCIAGTVENLRVGMSADLKVGSDVTANALNIARGGKFELSTTDATTGDTTYHNLALESTTAVTAAGAVTAASVDLSGVSSAGNLFGSLTTDKITLDVTNLSAGTSLLHIDTLTKLTPATFTTLDAVGGVALELTGIPADMDAETAVGATDARDWAKGFAEGEYTLLSYGAAVDGLTLTAPSLANIQQLFALDGMDATFVEQTANGVTNVVLTLSAAADREWSSDEPNWAGDPDQATGEVKLGIDLLTGRPTLAVATYDAFNTVQKVTMKGDYTIDLSETTDAAGNKVDIAMTSETDPDRGLVIRELDGTGTLTLVGSSADSGNPADVATLINKSADQVLTGDLEATNMTVNVESAAGAADAKLTVSGITLQDSALNVLGTGKLATTGDTSVTNGSLTVEDGGEFFAADMTLSGDAQVTNKGTLSAGVVTLSGDGARLDGAAGTTTVESLNGTTGTLAGTIAVTGQGGDYRGSYENATVELAADAEQTLAAGAGLSLSGSNASATLISTDAPVTMDSIDVTDTDITLSNMGADGVNTLTVAGGSGMTGGTLAFDVSAEGVMMGDDQVVTSGLELDGTAVLATSTTPLAPATFDLTQDTDGMTLFTLEDSGVSAADVTLAGDFFLRYFDTNSLTVENGAVKADLITDYYTSRLAETENGTTGMQMLDMAFLQVNPQAGDLADVFKSLDDYVQTNNVGAADKLAAAVAGSGVASLGMAIAGDVERQLKAIRNRTTTMGVDPAVVNEDMPYFNAWINAEGDHRSLDEDSTYAGYSLSSWGGTVGFDMDVNPNLTWGLALSAMYGDFSAESPDAVEGDVSTYYVSAFARATRGAWVHTFVATLGISNTELSRTVSHQNGSYTTDGDADGMSFGLLYEVGRTYALNEDATACWQPVFNVAYRHTQVDSFSETGSDAALRFGEQTLDTVTFGLGGRLQAVVGESLYNRTSIFEARALLKLDAGDRESTVDSSMLGASAAHGSLKSAEMDAFGLELGAGITVPMGMDSGSIFADGSIEFRGSYTSVNATFGYRLNF